MCAREISVSEFEKITVGKQYGRVEITKEDIYTLKQLIDEDSESNNGIERFLSPIRNGVRANNYVGVIQLKTGLTIEILPKIITMKDVSHSDVRKMFFKMLKSLRINDGKKFDFANLNSQKQHMAEIFIKMFLKEVDFVIKKGLKSSYVERQSNENFLKGKLLLNQHIQKNGINKTKFFIQYDEFLVNSPENQLVKTTLQKVYQLSSDFSNQKMIREQLLYFEKVQYTKNLDSSFSKVDINRQFSYYKQVIAWCKLFLENKSFTSFKGSNVAFSLLFPMELIYESYIATSLKRVLKNYTVTTQEHKHHLFDEFRNLQVEKSRKRYLLKPDIVLRSKEDESLIIVDTKWKILDRFGPSQGDMYQMFAYSNRYTQKSKEYVDKVILLFPLTDSFHESVYNSFNKEIIGPVTKIEVRFIDCFADIDLQLMKLVKFL